MKLFITFNKEIEDVAQELLEECEISKRTVDNLQNEKKKLLETAQNMETKYEDMRMRHDVKTDMVGKLSIKVFLLMTEIEKLTVT